MLDALADLNASAQAVLRIVVHSLYLYGTKPEHSTALYETVKRMCPAMGECLSERGPDAVWSLAFGGD